MNVQSLITIGAALVAGVAGGVVASSSGGGDVTTTSSVEIGELRAQLDKLATQNREMQSRIEMLEMLPDVSHVAPAERTSIAEEESLAEKERMLDDLLGRMSQQNDGGAVVPANFADQVKQVYSDIRREEEAARDKEREQRRQEAFDARLDRYVKELGLNVYQTNQLRDTLTNESEAFEDVRNKVRESGDFSGMRDLMTTVHASTKASLATFLSNEQLQKYDELSGGDRGFFRGFDGGGPGGPGGGRGGRGGRRGQ